MNYELILEIARVEYVRVFQRKKCLMLTQLKKRVEENLRTSAFTLYIPDV